VVDGQAAKYSGTPGYTANPSLVAITSGGNPNLVPEIGSTLTVGTTFSPSFFRGFSASIDYYDISVARAIFTLSGSLLTQACNAGSVAACSAITRDSTGTVTAVRSNSQNLANFSTRGIDFEVAYVTPLSRFRSNLGGTISIRSLATYVQKYVVGTGVTQTDTAGDVGNTVGNAIPHWRGTLSLSYQGRAFGFDARVRYVGGGKYDHLQTVTTTAGVTRGLINNDISARTYVDLGAQFRMADRFELFGTVNNVFNRAPPLITSVSTLYDVIGTYFNFGARIKF
jgi:outer membrane receptor protein involved in Fe transport